MQKKGQVVFPIQLIISKNEEFINTGLFFSQFLHSAGFCPAWLDEAMQIQVLQIPCIPDRY